LLNNGYQLRPAGRVLVGTQSGTEEPVCLRVYGCDSDLTTTNVEIGHIVLGEVHGEATARTVTLERVVEANCRWVVEQEMRG